MTDPLREAAQAPSRPPDRVSYGALEPITAKRDRMRATRTVGALFPTVLEWTRFEDEEVVGWRRKRMEFWDEPLRVVAERHGDEFVARTIPARTIGRWEWEELPR